MRLSIVFCLSWKPHHTMSLLWCLSTHWLSRRSAMLARNLAILDPTIIVKNQLLRQVEITNMGGMSVYRHFSKIKALNVWDGFTMWNIQDGFTSMSCMTVPYGLSGGKWMWNLLFVGVVKWGGEEVKCLHFGCPCADQTSQETISIIWWWYGPCASYLGTCLSCSQDSFSCYMVTLGHIVARIKSNGRNQWCAIAFVSGMLM